MLKETEEEGKNKNKNKCFKENKKSFYLQGALTSALHLQDAPSRPQRHFQWPRVYRHQKEIIQLEQGLPTAPLGHRHDRNKNKWNNPTRWKPSGTNWEHVGKTEKRTLQNPKT